MEMCIKTKTIKKVKSNDEIIIEERNFEYPASARPHPLFQNRCIRMLAVIAAIFCAFWNVAVRAQITISVGGGWLTWFYVGLDVSLALTMTISFVMFLVPPMERKRLFLSSSNPEKVFPRVDVLLPMCNEELSIQQETIISAASMDYPQDKLKVFVLDDGGNDELKSWCETTFQEKGGVSVKYLSREKIPGKPHHFKAGNLNYGIQVSAQEAEVAEYIAVFDSDMMPVRSFIRRLIPHFLTASASNRLALVGCPQRFFNIPHGDPLAQEFGGGLEVLFLRLDALGCSLCLGSGFITRRTAICDIGGIPTASTGEDVNTSVYLYKNGWSIGYVHEDLQIGRQPDALAGHIQQRKRWYANFISTFREHFGFLWNTAQMTLVQKSVIFFIFFINIFAPLLQTVLSFLAVFFLCATSDPLIGFDSVSDIGKQVKTSVAFFLALNVVRIVCTGHVGLLRLRRDEQYGSTMAPYYFQTFIRQLLPPCLGGFKLPFVPSGLSLGTDDMERDPCFRLPFWRRVAHLLFRRGVWVHLFFLVAAFVAIASRCIHIWINPEDFASALTSMVREAESSDDFLPSYLLRFVVYVGFPPIWIIFTVQYYAGFVWYVLFPPSHPPTPLRENMLKKLEHGEGGEVYVPKQSLFTTLIHEIPTIVVLVYGAVLLIWCPWDL